MVVYRTEKVLEKDNSLSDLIIDDLIEVLKKKKGKKYCLVDASLSSGKSYTMINGFAFKLAEQLRKRYGEQGTNKKILFLTNRIALKNQILSDYEIDKNSDYVEMKTYQKLTRLIGDKDDSLKNYPIIIADEAHFFFADSDFSRYTELAMKYLMESESVHMVVFMTATASLLTEYLNDNYGDTYIDAFKVHKKIIIRDLYYYRKDRIKDILMDLHSHEEYSKFLYFRNHKKKNEEFAEELKRMGINAICISKESNNSNGEDNEELESIINKQRLREGTDGIIATSFLDNGINITDENIKTIIIEDFMDIESAVQCIGRKRIALNENVDLYIKMPASNVCEREIKELKKWNDVSIAYYSAPEVLFGVMGRGDLSQIIYIDSDMTPRINTVREEKIKHQLAVLRAYKKKPYSYIERIKETLKYDIEKEYNLDLLYETENQYRKAEMGKSIEEMINRWIHDNNDNRLFRNKDYGCLLEGFIHNINAIIPDPEALKTTCHPKSVNKVFRDYNVPFHIKGDGRTSIRGKRVRYWEIKNGTDNL